MKQKEININRQNHLEEQSELVCVFSSNNKTLFDIAKTLLNKSGIRFWSNGDYMSLNLTGSPYNFEIKVYEKDEKAAGKLLGDVVQNKYEPSNESDKKMRSFIQRWGILIIILSVILMIIIFYLFKWKE